MATSFKKKKREHKYYPHSLIYDYASATRCSVEVTCIALINDNSLKQVLTWQETSPALYKSLKEKYSMFCPSKPKQKNISTLSRKQLDDLENLEVDGRKIISEGFGPLPPYKQIVTCPYIQQAPNWI